MIGRPLAVVAAALSAGCVYSDHSLCSPDKLVFEPELAGTWALIGKKEKTEAIVQITPRPETRAYDVHMTHSEPGKQAIMVEGRACLVELNGVRYASFQAAEKDETPNSIPAGVFLSARIERRSGDLLGIDPMWQYENDVDHLYAGLQRRPAAEVLVSGETPTRDFVLTSPTVDLQKAVIDPDRGKMFEH